MEFTFLQLYRMLKYMFQFKIKTISIIERKIKKEWHQLLCEKFINKKIQNFVVTEIISAEV